MKLNYFFIYVLAIGLLAGCKSKKNSVKNTKSSQNKVVVHKKASKSSITNSTFDYIKKYKETAMEEMRTYKIPASITLAQGILESSSGKSNLTRKSNNHFGIKCHKGWKGKRVYHDDDEKGECFRVYKNPKKSYRDHSLFLAGRNRYSKLFKFKKGDYIRWAKGLSAAGYATDRRYPAKLIAIIEKYDLHKYDAKVLGKRYKKERPKKNTKNSENHVVKKGIRCILFQKSMV